MENNNDDITNKIQNIANSLDNKDIEQLLSLYENEETNQQVQQPIIENHKEEKISLNEVIEELDNELPDELEIDDLSSKADEQIKEIENTDKKAIEAKQEIKEEVKKELTKTEELHQEIEEKRTKLEEGIIELNDIENSLIEENDSFIETNTEKDTINAMEQIATSTLYSQNLLNYTDPKVSENQFKLFIIAQCKRELYKILEYSKMLDKLEERFKQIYIDRLEELPDSMIVGLMNVVVEKIDRGNELINSVIKDKDITNVLIINQQNNQLNNISDLTKDKLLQTLYKSSELKAESPSASRAKVVEVVTNILKDDATEEDTEEIEEVVEEQPIEQNNIIKENKTEAQLVNEDIDKKLAELQRKRNQQ